MNEAHEDIREAQYGRRARNSSRRAFISKGACALLVIASAQVRQLARSDTPLRIDEMEAQLGGRIGVAAIDTNSGARLAHRGDERFAMCSTFKWMLTAAVLARNDQHHGGILERHLSFGAKDLLAHSPVTERHVAEGSLANRRAMQCRRRDERQHSCKCVVEVHRWTGCADAIFARNRRSHNAIGSGRTQPQQQYTG